MSLGKNIAKFRKEKGWTQSELGEKLGISNQAISKWESEMNMPDVLLLPALADLFGCYIDELFQRNVIPEKESGFSLPWENDDVIRCVVFKGHEMLTSEDDITKNVTFEIAGNALSVVCDGNVVINGIIAGGGCTAQGNVSVSGRIIGECTANGNITVGDRILGTCTAGANISAGYKITGACTAHNITTEEDMFDDMCDEDVSKEDAFESIEDTLDSIKDTLDSLQNS